MIQIHEKMRVKLNHNKSVHTLKHGFYPNVSANNIPIAPLDTVKYLGMSYP